LTIPIFTRLLLPEEYGILSIFLSVISIFTILMGMNFHGSVARRYYEKDDEFKTFLGTNTIFLLVINAILLIIIFFIRDQLASFFAINGNLFFIAVVVSSFGFFTQIELAYLQASQQSEKYASISVIRNIITVAIAIIWVYLLKENRYMGKVYAQLITSGIIFIFVINNLIKLSKFKFEKQHVKYALSFGVPLIPHALSGFILAQFDRVIINQISGSYETGLYSFAYNIGMLMNVFVMSMNKSWMPIFYENLKNKAYENIENLGEKYIKITFLISLGLILFSREIVMIMADEKYFKALEIVPIVIMGYIGVFLYTLYAGYTFYRKKTGLISLFTFIAGFVNIGLNYMFIPKYGYIAAAWTTLISYFLLFALHYINAKFILKEKVIKEKNVIINLPILVIFTLLYLNFSFRIYWIQLIYKILLVVIIAGIYFNKEIKKLVKK